MVQLRVAFPVHQPEAPARATSTLASASGLWGHATNPRSVTTTAALLNHTFVAGLIPASVLSRASPESLESDVAWVAGSRPRGEFRRGGAWPGNRLWLRRQPPASSLLRPVEIGKKCPFTTVKRVYRMVSAPDPGRRPGVDGDVNSRKTYDPRKSSDRATEFTGNVASAGSGPPEAQVEDGLQRHDSSTKGPSVK